MHASGALYLSIVTYYSRAQKVFDESTAQVEIFLSDRMSIHKRRIVIAVRIVQKNIGVNVKSAEKDVGKNTCVVK